MTVNNNGIKLTDVERTESAATRITGARLLEGQNDFNRILNDQLNEKRLQFSKHANMRLSSRDIALSSDQMQRVEDGVSKAGAKGIKDSLVFVDNVALVVNIRSKTVITAIDTAKNNDNEAVFTNIDGAVIV